MPTEFNPRVPEHSIDSLFINRWSPRAFTGEEIPPESLLSFFEAAKWAPSWGNSQPWRFIYARRNTASWDKFFNLLVEGNQAWAKNAAALIVMIAKNTYEHNGKAARTHSFDSGAAWMSFALQASLSGWSAHGMGGFNYEAAKSTLNIPDDFDVQAMAAVGRRASKETLPPALQEREVPNQRKHLNEIVFEGSFKDTVVK